MQLNTIKPAVGAKRPRRRVGRGIGSGLGKTAGRGHKVDLLVLKQHGLAGEQTNAVKVIKTGEIKRAVTLKGLSASAGAKAAIEAAGGKVLAEV
mgnify:CR=1 FL=1